MNDIRQQQQEKKNGKENTTNQPVCVCGYVIFLRGCRKSLFFENACNETMEEDRKKFLG